MSKQLNIWQRAMLAVAPTWTVRRMVARHAAEQFMGRSYQAAGGGRRAEGWRGGSSGANAEARNALIKLRNRSRELVRNNPYARRVVDVIPANVVGTGIQARPDVQGQQPYRRIKQAWTQWAETMACDWGERTDFYGLQAQVMRAVVESGECLVLRRRLRNAPGRVPLQLQVLEADYLDHSRDMMLASQPGNEVVQGVEYSGGKVVGYWLYDRHPGELYGLAISRFVPVEDVLHIYRVDRPGQVRGIPWLAPVMVRLNDFDTYEDAQLQRQMVAACFAGFIQDTGGGDGYSGLPTVQGPNGQKQTVDRLEPGMMEILPPGKTITFASPPPVDGYAEYSKQVLRSIAVGTGISYEMLTGDLTGVNFSSGRMGWIEAHRQVTAWQWQIMVNQLCEPVWRWFMEAAALANVSETVGARWTPPRREMIDPVKETAALQSSVRNGFTSLSQAIQSLGDDPETMLPELAADLQKLDALGLVLDSDPRRGAAPTPGEANVTPPPQ